MGAVLYEDTLQQRGKHVIKQEWWRAHSVSVVRTRFDGKHDVPVSFGDYYAEGSNIVVDTKRNIDEIAQNISGKNHVRFREECKRAQRDGYRLVVLVENYDGIRDYDKLRKWVNTHCVKCSTRRKTRCNPTDNAKCKRHNTRKPIQGARLVKAMQTMTDRYGVKFMFCNPHETARIVCELLGVMYEQDDGSGTKASRSGDEDNSN